MPAAALSPSEQGIVAGLDPSLRPLALEHRARVLAAGIPFRFTSGRRSAAEQAELYNDRASNPYPVARRSKHELGAAYDATGPRNAAEWASFGTIAEALGLKWGGRFRDADPVHVELKGTFDELQELLQSPAGVGAGLVLLVAIVVMIARRRTQ